jgi:hypothetical protein
MDRGAGGGGMGDLPWASIFDPSANARALSAIQAEGFRAASELVDRFVRTPGGGRSAMDLPQGATPPIRVEQRESIVGAMDLEPLMRSWFSMVGQYLIGSERSVPTVVDDAELDLAGSSASGTLELGATVPGMATAEVWLHNRSAEDLGDIRLHCSDLMAHAGNLIHSDEVRVDPDVVAMPPRCSRGIAVEVKVSQGISPGVYRGNLLVQDHSELWLPVALRVRAQVA